MCRRVCAPIGREDIEDGYKYGVLIHPDDTPNTSTTL